MTVPSLAELSAALPPDDPSTRCSAYAVPTDAMRALLRVAEAAVRRRHALKKAERTLPGSMARMAAASELGAAVIEEDEAHRDAGWLP